MYNIHEWRLEFIILLKTISFEDITKEMSHVDYIHTFKRDVYNVNVHYIKHSKKNGLTRYITWYKNGMIERDSGNPSVLIITNFHVISKSYYLNNKIESINGKAGIKKYTVLIPEYKRFLDSKQYYKNGLLNREQDKPSVIFYRYNKKNDSRGITRYKRYISKKDYYKNGLLHRDKFPSSKEYFLNDKNEIFALKKSYHRESKSYRENGKAVFYLYSCEPKKLTIKIYLYNSKKYNKLKSSGKYSIVNLDDIPDEPRIVCIV